MDDATMALSTHWAHRREVAARRTNAKIAVLPRLLFFLPEIGTGTSVARTLVQPLGKRLRGGKFVRCRQSASIISVSENAAQTDCYSRP